MARNPSRRCRITNASTPKARARRGTAGLSLQTSADRNRLLTATAYHEAGHAVVGYYFGKWIRERGLRIGMNGRTIGSAHLRNGVFLPLSSFPKRSHKETVEGKLRAECMELLAGACSEQRAVGWRRNGAHTDEQIAVRNIETVHGCKRSHAELILYGFYLPATRRLVRRPDVWRAIELLAKQLRRRRYLTDDMANKLLEQSGVRPVPHTYFRRYR